MATQMKLTAASEYSTRDLREAKRTWSQRLLLPAATAPVTSGAPR